LRDIDVDYALPSAALADLERDGHVTLRGVLPGAAVADLRVAVQRATARLPALVPTAAEGDAYARAFVQHMNLWRVDEVVARYVLSRRLGGLAARLLRAPAARLYHDQALCKPPSAGATPWHQDKHYWPIDAEMLTLWLPLVDLTQDMGELLFARGSHRQGALSQHPISARSDAELGALARERGYAIAGTGPLRAGDASVHLAWTLHSAAANVSAVAREVMTAIYLPDGARVGEPANAGQRADLSTWLPGLRPGDLAASPLNPRVPVG
jgi:ectoine hydroxylase-related dioxygenase (phytanoyl-CoA dioxygenase family)